jgi:hypothetical protein
LQGFDAATIPEAVSGGDDDLAAGVAGLEIADRCGDSVQRVGSVDDGRDLPGFDGSFRGVEIVLVAARKSWGNALGHDNFTPIARYVLM